MTKFLFLLATVVVCQNVSIGKSSYGDILSGNHKTTDHLYPSSKSFGSEHDLSTREAESQNSAEQASLCYFIQESEMESQISCRLRFTRSKFNFNPFGLRFGKREMYSTTNGKSTVFTNNKLLSYVLSHQQSRFSHCKENKDC
ncbi:kisspeptin 2 [Polypterus senegalus]|uniref:kisspeptin 2 n=1 Tax=Polypterus senegalus TaxID=55291 RepID=UPI001965B903|nr:kisspeptin 2 [Polypterus senegalus]